ncbi:MAG: HAMP domain-containing protein [Deltaproteobacteria bacterium]|nr:HAMP domain-containing protein [Deltaproteobacteria bacterium]
MRSLVQEINAAIALTLLVVAIIVGVGFFPYQQKQKNRFIDQRLLLLKTFKKSEERTLVDHIFEQKAEALYLQLERLGATPGIERIRVYDAEGRLLAGYPRSVADTELSISRRMSLSAGKEIHEIASWNKAEALIYWAPFEVVGETLGYLQIVYSLEDLSIWQRTSMIFFMLLLLSMLITSMILLNRLMSRLVARPILKLATTVEKVEGGDLSARSENARNDEIGQLSDAFNGMIERLQKGFQEIEKQNLELKELDQLKNEFLANVSHEIRTPLHAIIGFSEGMVGGEGGLLNEEQKKYLKMILESGKTLNSLVGQLLDFSQIKAGKMVIHPEAFPIRRILEAVLPVVREILGKKPVQLVNHVPEDLPWVMADEARVRQIFLNLLENAVKFTKEGTVEVLACPKGKWVQFTVKDTGIGMEQETIQFIFDEFRQGDGSTRREYGGTGLGLSIVKQLVTLHGGEIWVETMKGKGSSFHFTLPSA